MNILHEGTETRMKIHPKLAALTAVIALTACSSGSSSRSISDTASPVATEGQPRTVTHDEGWSYSLSVAFVKFDPSPSPLGCEETPPPGNTNAWFTIVVKNLLTDRPAPYPWMFVSTNLDKHRTALNPNAMEDFKNSRLNANYDEIEISPNSQDLCLAAKMTGEGEIAAGGSVTFTAVVGSIPDPAPSGLALLVEVDTGHGRERFEFPASS